jgi:uncharacterized repeat protein (TIGR02543 family)
MKRMLSTALAFVLLLSLMPLGMIPALAASANTTVDAAIASRGYAQGPGVYTIDISGDPTVIGTLDLNGLKIDYPDLAYINVSNTNITDMTGSGVSQVISNGTFADSQRALTPASASLTYSLASSGSGIDLDALVADLQPNVSDGTTASGLISGLVGCTIDGSTVSPVGGTYGVIPDSALQSLSVGVHTLALEFTFNNVSSSWTYTVTYNLNITDQVLVLTPSSVTTYQGSTVVLTLEKLDEAGNAVDVGTDTGASPNLVITNPFGSSTYTTSKVGNKLEITINIDPAEAAGIYTLSVHDSLSGKTASADIDVQALGTIVSLELEEYYGGASIGALNPSTDTMFIKGGTSVSSATQANVISSGSYTDSTVYLLYNGITQLGDEYCSVLQVTDLSTSGTNVTGEFISVNGKAALRISGAPTNTGISGDSFRISSTSSVLGSPIDINYSIVPSIPEAYVLYMVDGSAYPSPTVAAIQNLIDNVDPALTPVAVYEDNNGWNPVGGSTANMLEQKDAWFVVAARYESNGTPFVVPYNSVTGWYESDNGSQATVFNNGTMLAFTGASDIKGQTASAGGGATRALMVVPQLGSGGDTVTAVAQVSDGSATNTLFFNISVAPRSIDRYEFRNSAGGALSTAETRVPIGTSKDYQIYVVYDNGYDDLIDFSNTPLTVTFGNTTAFPSADNPGSLTSGTLMTVTGTSAGGSNDALSGTSSTVTVKDAANKTGSVTLTLDNSQIKGLTYYVETPEKINAYDGSGEIKEIYSAAEFTSALGSVLEIPRGLEANVWAVPVFTNTEMYDATTTSGDWQDYGVVTSWLSGVSAAGGNLTAPMVSTTAPGALAVSAKGDLKIDIGDPITAMLGISSSVSVNGKSHDLNGSPVSANFTVKITDPIVTHMAVDRWDDATTQYVSIPFTAGTGYTYTGSVGDELKLRVKVVYSDGNSVDIISNNASTYAGGVYFLPMDDPATYDPSIGYTSTPAASSFGVGDDTELGVLHGYFMSHYPTLAGYFGLVNPTSGTPSALDWNNGISSTALLQTILADLSRQIELHQTSGDVSGVTTGYLSKNGGIVPGHYSVKLNQAGSYTFDFSGTYATNGYNSQTAIDGIGGSPLTINLTVTPPTIERVYLVSDELSLLTPASSLPGTDLYEFDKTSVATFKVYPLILDSSYYLTSAYDAAGVLPAYLSGTGSAGTAGISKIKAAHWASGSIGSWMNSNTGSLYITQKEDGSGYIYLEVTVLSQSDIPQTSPVTISLALSLTQASGVTKYDLTTVPGNPNNMDICTTTDPSVQDIIVGSGYSFSGGSGSSVDLGDSIYFPVKYIVSGSTIPRYLNSSEYPGSVGTTNVLKVTADPSNPGPCAISVDSITGDLKFIPTAVGPYIFVLSTVNVSGTDIPTASQGSRTITFTVTPQTLTQGLYYGESRSVSGLPSGTATLTESGGTAQLDAVALSAGWLKMTSNQNGNTTVEARDASGVVIANVQVTLYACTHSITLSPSFLTNSGTWYTFGNGESMRLQWKTEYVKAGGVVTCVEYDDVASIAAQGPDDFLTLTGGILTAQAPSGATSTLYGVYTAMDSAGATHVIYATLDPSAGAPSYTYELHDSNSPGYAVLNSITLTAGQTRNVYVYDLTNSAYVNSFTAGSNNPGNADVTNMGAYARIEALATGTATITFNPLQGGTASLSVTVTAPVAASWTVGGSVNDGGTSTGISGAAVDLINTSGTTVDTTTASTTGQYFFSNVADGNYTVQASASGYNTNSTNITVNGANIANADITLTATAPGTPAAAMSLSASSISAGSTSTATVTASNFSGSGLTYTWSSSNPAVATVPASATTGTATITGVSAGTATISCDVSDGITTVTASASITVTGGGGGGGGGGGTTATYTVSFNSQGGSNVSNITSISSGSKITAPVNPTRAGYTFTGWYKESGCENKWNFSTDTVTKNTTLYAAWKADGTNHFAYISGKAGGIFSPDIQMTRAEVAVTFARLLQESSEFTGSYSNTFMDVSTGAWYANAVGFVQSMGLINGYPDGSFRPENNITRAEFAAIVNRFADAAVSGSISYTDVPESHWAYSYIRTISNSGWTNGYPDGSFRPENNITRAEVVAIVNRMTGRSIDKDYINENLSSLNTFSDVAASHWAYYDILEAANSHGFIKDGATESWAD